jgi:ABC-type branched-subunit amino acid transport system substrate-binding protein
LRILRKDTAPLRRALGRAAVLAGLFSFTATGALASPASAAPAPLHFGVVAPLTGSMAELGKFISDPCFAAARVINQNGGILGHQVACTLIDDTGDPADAVPNVTKALATTPNLVGVLGIDSNVAAAIVPIINNAKIPMVSSNGLSEFIRNTYPYFWRMTPPDVAEGASMGLWAAHEGWKRVAIVLQNDVGDTGNKPGLLDAARAEHLTVVSDVTIPGDSSSYDSVVNRIRLTKPEVLLFSADTQTIATFLSNYKVLNSGKVPPVITPTQVMAPDFFNVIRKVMGNNYLIHDIYFVGAYLNENTPQFAQYFRAMKATPQVQNPEVVVSTGPIGSLYDGMMVMALAMIAAHSTQGPVVNRYIPLVTTARKGAVVVHNFAEGVKELRAGHAIQYVGVVGPISFNKYHNSPGWFAIFSAGRGDKSVARGQIGPAELASVLR